MGKAVDTFLSESTTAQAVLEKLGVKKETVVPAKEPKVPVVRAD
jgi:hypothetical protein